MFRFGVCLGFFSPQEYVKKQTLGSSLTDGSFAVSHSQICPPPCRFIAEYADVGMNRSCFFRPGGKLAAVPGGRRTEPLMGGGGVFN